jgi:histidinol-phosphatase
VVTVDVGSQVSGRIQELFADFNSPVKKGERIAKIDPSLFQAAVISAPALHGRWWARRGGGAWARSVDDDTPRRIRVSSVGGLGDAQVLYGSGHDIETSGVAPGFHGLLGDVWRERGFGDFWGYTLVADGAAEAMVEGDLGPWDLAAPWIVVEEAGGRVSDSDGRRAYDRGESLATNGLLHEMLLDHLWGRAESVQIPGSR